MGSVGRKILVGRGSRTTQRDREAARLPPAEHPCYAVIRAEPWSIAPPRLGASKGPTHSLVEVFANLFGAIEGPFRSLAPPKFFALPSHLRNQHNLAGREPVL